jgi:putative endonuclease
MSCIYVLQSSTNNKFYIGSSRDKNPDSRLKAHNSGKTRSTKSGKPWKVVYFENYPDYTSARKRELFLKTGVGRKWIKDNIKIN